MNETTEIDTKGIAVIGMAGKYAGAKDLEAFWRNLRDGVESITFFTDEELKAGGVDPALIHNPNYVKAGLVVEGADTFDAGFFGFNPKEAEIMDPQQRMFLECAWESLENAGYVPSTYKDLIGVYAGAAWDTYLLNNLVTGRVAGENDFQVFVTNDKDFMSTRVSYKLNLRGPSLTIQTACSTSLVAIHQACLALLNYECDMALAGGVTLLVPQISGYLFQEGGIDSPDGHCRAFDAKANGTIFGSGVGVVTLKRLEEALEDGDTIHAVIKGSAINNDGSQKVSYTAPGVDGQAEVVAAAQAVAGVEADTIQYIETHGTATSLGDPIEVTALNKVFRAATDQKQFCAIGSVKTNIGHLSVAAGVTGLIKTVLSLENKQIPPSLNFETPNPKIDFENSPFYVNTKLTDWPRNGTPRRAGVSSFGVGGTNAHVILEEAPVIESAPSKRPWQLLVLSAKTETALEAATANLTAHLKEHPNQNLADTAYTLQVGRTAFRYRRMLVCRDVNDALTALEAKDVKRILSAADSLGSHQRPIAFMFSGQGSQYVNMTRDLYNNEPRFKSVVDQCCGLLRPHLGLDLRTLLYPAADQVESATGQLTQTALAQPALFVVEYALAQLWMAWGVHPQAMTGHSLGEYVAACLSGVLSLEDALMLVAARGQLMQRQPAGSMLAVPLSEEDVRPWLGQTLDMAAINGPTQCVVSGPTEAIEALRAKLAEAGVEGRPLHTSHAFHSSQMEGMVAPFVERVRKVKLHAPQIPYISNISGTWITAEEATNPAYWGQHVRAAVRFADGVQTLLGDPNQILLEVGPGTALCSLARQHTSKQPKHLIVNSVRHPQEQATDDAILLQTLGKLWMGGAAIDWQLLYADEQRQRVPLPTYPFERQRYWVEPTLNREYKKDNAQLAKERKPDLADWFYIPSWKRSMPPTQKAEAGNANWLIFCEATGLGDGFAQRLSGSGQKVIRVLPGERYEKLDNVTYRIAPDVQADYQRLLADLQAAASSPNKIIHLWGLTPNDAPATAEWQKCGFYSLIALAQTLGLMEQKEEIELRVMTNNLQAVTGNEALQPEKATVLGPCKVIPQEYPQIICQNIDLILPGAGTPKETRLIDWLMAECETRPIEPAIAYRGYDRWIQTFEPVRLDEAPRKAPQLRAGGVYLITGGLGGIGLELADSLAQTVETVKLVLVGRSSFPAPETWAEWLSTHPKTNAVSGQIQRLLALQQKGADVLVLSADVADEAQMQAVIKQTMERFGGLHGVIHAAGVAGGGIIQLKTPGLAERVLSPKVSGTRVLERVLAGLPLDFLALCSSVTGIMGGFGQVDYCAANAFLDIFAHYHMNATGIATMSINWDAWREVGMAVKGTHIASETEIHPLVETCLSKTTSQAVYATHLSTARQWVLDEHRIMKTPVLPGTAYLEIVRAAFADFSQSTKIEINELVFLQPLTIAEKENVELRVLIQQASKDFNFHVVSQVTKESTGEQHWYEHASGSVKLLDANLPAQNDLEAIRKNCQEQEVVFTERNQRIQGESMEWGPRWHNLKLVSIGKNEALASLELPASFASDNQYFGLHPALLDVATTFAIPFLKHGDYLPILYKQIKINGNVPHKLYSHVQYQNSPTTHSDLITSNIDLMDENGNVVVEILGFTMKKVTEAMIHPTVERHASVSAAILSAVSDTRAELRNELLSLETGLSSLEGANAFQRILVQNSLPQIIVSTRDLQAVIEQINSFKSTDILTTDQLAPKEMHSRPNISTEYAAPRTELERGLALIWQKSLGLESVGIYDSFFELGGDSLSMLGIISQAKEIGIQFTPMQMMQNPSIAELLAIAENNIPVLEAPAEVSGAFHPTIAQASNSQRGYKDLNYFNMSYMLAAHTHLNPDLLAQALQQVMAHHDGLRSRFAYDEKGIMRGHIAAVDDAATPFTYIDITEAPDELQESMIASIEEELDHSLDLSAGPLLRFALIHLGENKPQRLMIIIHHFVFDEISFKIILNDFYETYKCLNEQKTVKFQPKTTSVQQWTEKLNAYAQSAEMQQELDYWLSLPWEKVPAFPLDYPENLNQNTVGSVGYVTSALSVAETDALLTQLPKDQVSIRDALLTALVNSITHWSGGNLTIINEINSGRYAIPDAYDVDLSRTIGWLSFTGFLMFENKPADHPLNAVIEIKKQALAIPNYGLGYELLLYASENAAAMKKTKRAFDYDILFNFAGDQKKRNLDGGAFQQAMDTGMFTSARDAGVLESPHQPLNNLRGNVLYCSMVINDGQLVSKWEYSRNLHKASTIEKAVNDFENELRILITSLKKDVRQ